MTCDLCPVTCVLYLPVLVILLSGLYSMSPNPVVLRIGRETGVELYSTAE